MEPLRKFSAEYLEAHLGEDGELEFFSEENNLFPAFLDQLWSSWFPLENFSGPREYSSSALESEYPVGDTQPPSTVPDQLLNGKSPCTSTQKRKIPSLAARGLQCRKNLLADKRRRETLKQFIVLSTLLPGITKTDKISIIEEAVKYIRQLKEEIDKLKQYYPKQAVLAKKSQDFEKPESCSSYESSLVSCEKQLPEIEVRMYEKNILLTIRCQKDKVVLADIFVEIAKLKLTVSSGGIISFAGITYEIIIVAEMDTDCIMNEKNLVKELHSAFAIREKVNSFT